MVLRQSSDYMDGKQDSTETNKSYGQAKDNPILREHEQDSVSLQNHDRL